MNNLILEATSINSTTIIPNFGAIMKMGKTFMYNEFLKYDDGKLIKFVASKNGTDELTAKSEIQNWVEQLQKDLESGKVISLPGVGELSKIDGKVKFVAKTEPLSTQEPEVPKPVIEEKKEIKEIKAEEIKVVVPEVKKEDKVRQEVEEVSSDLEESEAITVISAFKDKADLIKFTRGEVRKSVVEALNNKLDDLNGKRKEVNIPEAKVAEKKEEGKKNDEVIQGENVEKITIEEKKEIPPVHTEPIVPLVNLVLTEEPSKEEKIEPTEEITKDEEPPKTIKEKVAEIETVKIDPKEEEAAIAAIVGGVEKTERDTKKRKKKWVLWIGLLLILIGGGTFGYIKKDMILGWFEKKHEPKDLAENHIEEDVVEAAEMVSDVVSKDENNEESIEESIEVIEAVEEESIIEEPVVEEKPIVTNSSSEGSWHIVAGSFSSEENANNKVNQLKEDGFLEAKILGKFNGLYTVRVSSHTTKDEAKNALENFKSSGNKGFIKNI